MTDSARSLHFTPSSIAECGSSCHAAALAYISPDPQRDAAERDLERVERLAEWMDRRYLDPLLGFFVPGAGDVLGSVIGVLTVIVAIRLRAHPIVIARMLLNLAFDALLGAVPIVGDLVDVFYRAHTKNLALLRDRDTWGAQPADWLVVGAAALAFVVAASVPIVLVVLTLQALW